MAACLFFLSLIWAGASPTPTYFDIINYLSIHFPPMGDFDDLDEDTFFDDEINYAVFGDS